MCQIPLAKAGGLRLSDYSDWFAASHTRHNRPIDCGQGNPVFRVALSRVELQTMFEPFDVESFYRDNDFLSTNSLASVVKEHLITVALQRECLMLYENYITRKELGDSGKYSC